MALKMESKATVETLIHSQEFKEKLYEMYNHLLEIEQELVDIIFLFYVEKT